MRNNSFLNNQISKNQNKVRSIDLIFYTGMLLFYILYFRIVCQSGLSADDMWNSNIWSSTYTGQDPAWSVIRQQMMVWLEKGRFFPFSNLAPAVYMMLPSVFAYKTAIVLTTYMDNLICSLCVKHMTGNRYYGYLYILLFPILIQLTPEFDSGLYCYHMLIQSVVLFGFFSIWSLLNYMETDHVGYAILSSAAFLIALGTYEVAFVFIFVLVYTAYEKVRSVKKMLHYLLPDLIVFLIMCAANVIVRVWFRTSTYDGIAVRLDIRSILITLLKQCSTCVPLGRYICAGLRDLFPYSDVYSYSIPDLIRRIRPGDILSVIFFVILLIYILRGLMRQQESEKAGRVNVSVLIISGLIIWITPGILIAISSKYQQILGWCSGHLPAYMQSLGFAMLITGIFLWLYHKMTRDRGRRILSMICGGIACVIIVLSQISGRDAVEFMNGFRKYPQDNIAYASDAGFFDEFHDQGEKYLIGTTCYIYDTSASRQFYTKFSKRNLFAEERQIFISKILNGELEVPYTEIPTENGLDDDRIRRYDMTKTDREYYGVFNIADRSSGALIVGRMTEVDCNTEDQSLDHIWIEDPMIYIRGDGRLLAGVDTSDWVLEESGKGYEIDSLTGRVDILQEPEYYSSEMGSGILYREMQ